MAKWIASGYKPGDILIFDFGSGIAHCGILEVVRGGTYDSIEGNTGTGNDANGGAVMRRTRYARNIVGAVRPDYGIGEADKLLAVARREIGMTELPAGSNKVKYNTEYYGREVSGAAYPWCMAFIWWCFRKVGLSRLFYSGGKTASCTALAVHAGMGKAIKTTGGKIMLELDMLRNGSRGNQVRTVQRLLIVQGYAPGVADGIFGARTESAVKEFQRRNGLTSDGIVGKQTWDKLIK